LEQYFTNNNNLKSEIRIINYVKNGITFSFNSDNGVFAKDKLDYGSSFLIETLLCNKGNYKNILDVGCGYGYIGIVLSKLFNCDVTMVDVNKRALHLTEMNIKENKVNGKIIESNCYENVKDKYDLIVSNPPIRAGNSIVLKILLEAKQHLNKDGELWYVIRKDQGAKSIFKKVNSEYNLELIDKSKGFYVYRAKNN
jgi:16S rRNA (guanine1207-N2)-methyltransferase